MPGGRKLQAFFNFNLTSLLLLLTNTLVILSDLFYNSRRGDGG